MNFRNVFERTFALEATVAAIVFVLVVLAMVFGIVRYRAGRRADASQNTEHPRVEIAFAVAVFAVALSMYVYTYRANGDESVHAPPAVTVAVTGFQWCWSFHYLSPSVTVTGDCIDGDYPTLVLPVGEPVAVVLTSDDVIHSFWIPFFRYKLDAFPTHRNHFELTISHPGVWKGHCAQFCGIGHSSMLFTVRAVPPAQFQQWLAAQPAASAVGGTR